MRKASPACLLVIETFGPGGVDVALLAPHATDLPSSSFQAASYVARCSPSRAASTAQKPKNPGA